MKTELCPVCQGRQTVPPGFYTPIGTSSLAAERCRSCDGLGYIVLSSSTSGLLAEQGAKSPVKEVTTTEIPKTGPSVIMNGTEDHNPWFSVDFIRIEDNGMRSFELIEVMLETGETVKGLPLKDVVWDGAMCTHWNKITYWRPIK